MSRRSLLGLSTTGIVILWACGDGATAPAPVAAPEPTPQPIRCAPGACVISPGFGPNEPEGHVVIFSMDGTSKDFGAPKYGKAWGDPTDPTEPIQTQRGQPGFNTVHVVPDAATPSGSALEFVYARGKRQGFAGAAFFSDWPEGFEYQDLYVRLLYKMDPAWTHHAAGTTKILYLGYGDREKPVQFFLANRHGRLELVESSGSGEDPIHQVGDLTMQPGVWYDIEMVIRGQTSINTADGGMEMWVNGQPVRDWRQRSGGERSAPPTTFDWQYVDGSEESRALFSGAQLGGWYGGSPDMDPGKPKDEWLRWGFLHISGLP